MTQKDELSRFLKSARARVQPGDWGLPIEGRRTKGLRREEVATLSGMSVTWYTWFEQGRDVQLSATMLERLARTLKLEGPEREFLFALAQHRPPPLREHHDDTVRPATQDMLDHLPVPALVMTQEWHIIGWNWLAARVIRDYGQLPVQERNLFKLVVLQPRGRRDEATHEQTVRQLTARLKWDYGRSTDPDAFHQLIEDMRAQSEVFARCWDTTEVTAHLEGEQVIEAEGIGTVTLRHTSYIVEQAPSQRLMIFTPANETTRRRLGRLNYEMSQAA